MPLYRDIYSRLRRDILSGKRGAGTRLPSTRQLAQELGLARGTVEAAYQLLAAEGYVTGAGAAGTVVAPGLSRALPKPNRAVATSSRSATTPVAGPLAFQLGIPAVDRFPRKLWSRTVSRVARGLDGSAMIYPDPRGNLGLRRAIASHISITRSIEADPAQIVITAGYQGGLALVCRALAIAGSLAAVEDPGYFMARRVLDDAGARLTGVPVDSHGIRVEVLRHGEAPRLIVVTPTHQFPLGMVTSASRRLELLDVASATKAWIVEDDYDSELHYEGAAAPSLKSLDRSDRVIYAGTFSKTLYPSLRLGFLVVPWQLLKQHEDAAVGLGSTPSEIMQRAVEQFMSTGSYLRHVGQMRRLYLARRAAMVAALQATRNLGFEVSVPLGGLHVTLGLPNSVKDRTLATRLRARGLAPGALSTCSLTSRPGNALLLSFANTAVDEAEQDVAKLRMGIEQV